MAMPRTLKVASLGLCLMLACSGNAETVPSSVPHGALSELAWTPLPEFGGAESIIYRSPDGKRVAAAFRESGDFTFEYPFDEFLIVTSGSGVFRVADGPTLHLKRGDYAYFKKGMKVHMTLSQDWSDVTTLMGDVPVAWR